MVDSVRRVRACEGCKVRGAAAVQQSNHGGKDKGGKWRRRKYKSIHGSERERAKRQTQTQTQREREREREREKERKDAPTNTHTHTHAHAPNHPQTHTHAQTHARARTHNRTRTNAHTHERTHAHTQKRTLTYTHAHTYKCIGALFPSSVYHQPTRLHARILTSRSLTTLSGW